MIEPAHIPAVLSFAHTFGDFAKALAKFRTDVRSMPLGLEVWMLGSCPWTDGGQDVLTDLASWVATVIDDEPTVDPLASPA